MNKTMHVFGLFAIVLLLNATISLDSCFSEPTDPISVAVSPVSRYIQITYPVPEDAPDRVHVMCAWSLPEAQDWRPAKVTPLVSETAMRLLPDDEWNEWTTQGRIQERRAAGLQRTVVFNPYPDA
jgi:hypothetical protein